MMIDLRTTGAAADNLQQHSYSTDSCATPAAAAGPMDNDWYYRYLLFSHFQHQDWQQKMLSAQAVVAQEMTLVKAHSVCGLCETMIQGVKQTPDTISRILLALNLKLPAALSKTEINEKVGLCNKCERQIKQLEEAASIRENLKETLISTLKHLSTSENHSPHNSSGVGSAFHLQRFNEITPDQHSIKRKISNIANWTCDSDGVRPKQLRAQLHPSAASPVAAASVYHNRWAAGCGPHADPTNSSDEENALMMSEASSASPHSSRGSYTPPPPPFSPPTSHRLQPSNSGGHQVLSELMCGRKRRKQARPAKAAGDIVPATPQHSSFAAAVLTSHPSQLDNSQVRGSRSPLPVTVTGRQLIPTPELSGWSAGLGVHQSPSPSLTPPSPHSETTKLSEPPTPSISVSSTGSTASSDQATSSPFAGPLPFTYTSLYQNNISQLLNSSQSMQSQTSALLLAQSIYNAAAASKGPLIAMNNPMMLSSNLAAGVSGISLPFSAKSSSCPRSFHPSPSLLVSAKKEPKPPVFSFATPPLPPVKSISRDSLVGQLDTSMAATAAAAAEAHTLVKTEKRRYCKVCASSLRKANNGRPPQSRFLCMICHVPMCRSCIEEHRYRVMSKGLDSKSDVKAASASAKLLQAVKMKDKASSSSPKQSSSTKSSISSTPPSHSSLIYGSRTAVALAPTSAHSPPAAGPPHNLYASILPNLPLLTPTPLDMRVQSYKPIAPAPPKLADTLVTASGSSISSTPAAEDSSAAVDNCMTDGGDVDEERPLVIAEVEEEEKDVVSPSPPSTPGEETTPTDDQTAITAEVANKTVAMLLTLDEECLGSPPALSVDLSDKEPAAVGSISNVIASDSDDKCTPAFQSSTITTIPQMGLHTAAPDSASSIPLQKCALATV